MAREVSDQRRKGKRTSSRREQIKQLLAEAGSIAESDEIAELSAKLEKLDDGQLRSEKYYLYFTQLGRCMYTGKAIDFDKIGNDSLYNIYHIYPQAKVKDDSLENKVLVESAANGQKSDTYPISPEIQNRMRGFWYKLYKSGHIGEKKYSRLTRSKPLNDDELAGFIARQLVETRQSTKAVAALLKEMLPDSRIVYVKAGIVSDFRQEMDMLKCREINDLHHAKDAYLNIVMGNVYNTKFTDDPLNFIKKHEKYSLKLYKKNSDGRESGLLMNIVERNGRCAWDPAASFDIVRKMMSRNSIRYVRYAYRRKGGLFNQQPEKAKAGLVERKKGLPTEKYGGYNNTTASFFSLIKAKNDIIFIPIELMIADKFLIDDVFAAEYVYNTLKSFYSTRKIEKLSVADIKFPLGRKMLKINTVLEIDGFRVNIRAKDAGGRYISASSAVSLILDNKYTAYAKKLENFKKRNAENKDSTVELHSGITKEMNEELYKCLLEKCRSHPFSKWNKFNEVAEIMEQGLKKFLDLNIIEQAKGLLAALQILKTGRTAGCDMQFASGVKSFRTDRISVVLDNKRIKHIHIIDQSPTGLFEKRSPNLLEL